MLVLLKILKPLEHLDYPASSSPRKDRAPKSPVEVTSIPEAACQNPSSLRNKVLGENLILRAESYLVEQLIS